MPELATRVCFCRDDHGKELGNRCAQLKNPRHGTWSIRVEVPPRRGGGRRAFRRKTYTTKTAATADRVQVQALIALAEPDDRQNRIRIGDLLEKVSSTGERIPDLEETRRKLNGGISLTSRITVGELLDIWIAGRRIRPRAKQRYLTDIRCHLKPRIGHHRIDRLYVAHLSEMFNDIIEANMEIEESNKARRVALAELSRIKGRENRQRAKEAIAAMPPFRRTTGPTSRRHIRATLRAALNAAISQGAITFNPAKHVELDPVKRPKPQVWTKEKVERWRETGIRPSPVMVWTPVQLGKFLDVINRDPLYCLFHLIAFRGLRRGEACGLRWEDVDLKAKTITVATQLIEYDGEIHESDPKSDAGSRVVVLDKNSVAAFVRHRAQQAQAQQDAGDSWVNTGRCFTREDGSWIVPAWLSDHFDRLVRRAELPPVRLHDLRHGAATIAHAAGADMKIIQEMLGHSSQGFTATTYTSVLPEVALAAAEAAAQIVPRQARSRRAAPAARPQRAKASTKATKEDPALSA